MIRRDLPFVNVTTIRMSTLHSPKATFATFDQLYGVLFLGNGFNPTNYMSVEWFFEVRPRPKQGFVFPPAWHALTQRDLPNPRAWCHSCGRSPGGRACASR